MKYIYPRAKAKYIPLWMYMVYALTSILDGLVNLFLLPFGYIFGLTGYWSERMLRHSLDVRKSERNKTN